VALLMRQDHHVGALSIALRTGPRTRPGGHGIIVGDEPLRRRSYWPEVELAVKRHLNQTWLQTKQRSTGNVKDKVAGSMV